MGWRTWVFYHRRWFVGVAAAIVAIGWLALVIRDGSDGTARVQAAGTVSTSSSSSSRSTTTSTVSDSTLPPESIPASDGVTTTIRSTGRTPTTHSTPMLVVTDLDTGTTKTIG